MTRLIPAALVLFLLPALILTAGPAAATEKMVGVVYKIELAADGTSADVTVLDNKTDEKIHVLVDDDLTLDKFKDHRIVIDDEVRVKYDVEGDKKHATYFRKTAGC
ncbi:MAG: hypothetical protein P1P84_16545 [Deferrisomatales bacterium]|nr:hypothetical protein [Deferrisomatales bacterium]